MAGVLKQRNATVQRVQLRTVPMKTDLYTVSIELHRRLDR